MEVGGRDEFHERGWGSFGNMRGGQGRVASALLNMFFLVDSILASMVLARFL